MSSQLVKEKSPEVLQQLQKGQVKTLRDAKTQDDSVQQPMIIQSEDQQQSQEKPQKLAAECKKMGEQQNNQDFYYEQFKESLSEDQKKFHENQPAQVLEQDVEEQDFQKIKYKKEKIIQKPVSKRKKVASATKMKMAKSKKTKIDITNMNDEMKEDSSKIVNETLEIRKNQGSQPIAKDQKKPQERQSNQEDIFDCTIFSPKNYKMSQNKSQSLNSGLPQKIGSIQMLEDGKGRKGAPQPPPGPIRKPIDKDPEKIDKKKRMKKLKTNYPNHVASLISTELISNGNQEQFNQFKQDIKRINQERTVNGVKLNWSLHHLKSVLTTPQRRQMVARTIQAKGRINILDKHYVNLPQNKKNYLQMNQDFVPILRSAKNNQEIRNPKIRTNGSA